MLGLQVDLNGFYRFASRQAKLGPLARRFRGMRPPRFPSVFEAFVNATACQQMSLTVGILLLNRLAEMCGVAWKKTDQLHMHFLVRRIWPTAIPTRSFAWIQSAKGAGDD